MKLLTTTDVITDDQNMSNNQRSIDVTSKAISDGSLLAKAVSEPSPTLASAMPVDNKTEKSAKPSIDPVLFEFDKSTVSAFFKRNLQPLVDYLKQNTDAKVTLTGHTDNIGSEEYNQMLSMRRATAVQQFLLQQGIDRKMIRSLGMGEKLPARSNDRPSGRTANRRVNIVLDE